MLRQTDMLTAPRTGKILGQAYYFIKVVILVCPLTDVLRSLNTCPLLAFYLIVTAAAPVLAAAPEDLGAPERPASTKK